MPRVPLKKSSNPRFVRIRALRNHVGLGFVASLSVLAGMTDAIGFLAVGDFISFMSGNTTRLAVAVGEGDVQIIVRLGCAVLAFVVGNALGVVVGRLGGRRALPLMLLISALLCTSALLPLEAQIPTFLTAVLAMGMLNAAVEQVNGLQVGLTYVTGALSRFGRSLGRWLLGEQRPSWRLQVAPWTGMLAGAVLGAMLEARFGVHAMLFSAGFAALLGLVSLKIPRRWQRDYMPK
ncbi:hypothetical protein AQS70_11525 [Pseudomonas endophytica]|uniref:DUF1275 family protein n=1 Tax=Pseudomonas endophytica TaxID=1563157 RepID=A0A0Q1CF74_9PSED|nr:YoaK family protein [Pseudomonas endophytica]KQB53197.1 hypothetical protein AQS70_11525 [Pseudomonas endophytica]